LPGGRERCFPRYNAELAFCRECPEWVREQCLEYQSTASGTSKKESLESLSRALSGEILEEAPF
jgi:hypothetical protein